MSPTSAIVRRQRWRDRSWDDILYQFHSPSAAGSPPSIDDAKDIYMDARRLQGKERVHLNWGRTLQAEKTLFEAPSKGRVCVLRLPSHCGHCWSGSGIVGWSGIEHSPDAIEDAMHDVSGKGLTGSVVCLYDLRGSIRRTGQLRTQPLSSASTETVLETFEGFVDQVDAGIAFVTLTSPDGETIRGEYAAEELASLGIFERRRFVCKTLEAGGSVRVHLEAVPDREVTPEKEAAFDREIDELLADDQLDGEY